MKSFCDLIGNHRLNCDGILKMQEADLFRHVGIHLVHCMSYSLLKTQKAALLHFTAEKTVSQ